MTDHGVNTSFDIEFGKQFKWDIPLLDGYQHKFIKNNSPIPGIYRGFFGIINWGLIKELKKLPKSTIVIVPGWDKFSFVLVIVAARVLGRTVYLRGETSYQSEAPRSKLYQILRKAILFILFKFINKFLYIGNNSKKFYKSFGIAEDRLIFTPYSVDNEFFTSEYKLLIKKTGAIKAKWNIPMESKVILFSGKLIERKNPLLLLKAFQKISEKVKAALIFMGDGNLRGEIGSIVKQMNIQNVFVTGFINQSAISEIYAVADIFVMCSNFETWGLSTNEAMNFGLPVVLSDNVGCSHDLVKGNGMIFKSGDADELAGCLIELINADEEKIQTLRLRSAEIINDYSYRNIVKNLQKLN